MKNEDHFSNVLDTFLEVNLEGDAFLCLESLNDKIKFSIQTKAKTLSLDSSDSNLKRKIFIVNNSLLLLACIQFIREDESQLYIYSGTQDFLNVINSRFEKEIKRLKEFIDRAPRKVLLGPKTLNRAFYPFQGSYRYMIGFTESQGSRPTMEDEIVIFGMGPRMRKNEDYFAIFDGHGGPEASAFAAKNLHEILDANLCNYPGYSSSLLSNEDITSGLQSAFRELDNSMCFQYGMQSGACALVIYISDCRMFTANLGDSRAIFGTKNGTIRITNDHKPMSESEYNRITSHQGGFVTTDTPPARVQGQLSVSRALGDRHLKPYVSGEPEIFYTDLTDDHYFVVLGCDGVWDKISDEEAAEITFKTNNPQDAALDILKKIKGKSDNISIVVIFLQHPKLWSQKYQNADSTITETVL